MPAYYQPQPPGLSIDYYSQQSPSPPTPTELDHRARLGTRPYPTPTAPAPPQQHFHPHSPSHHPALAYPDRDSPPHSAQPLHHPSSSHNPYPYGHHQIMRAPSSVQAPASYHAFSPPQQSHHHYPHPDSPQHTGLADSSLIHVESPSASQHHHHLAHSHSQSGTTPTATAAYHSYQYPPSITFPPSSSGIYYGQSSSLGMSHQKMKRKQVKNACTSCQRACKKCDDARPCSRCVKYGVSDSCVDSQRKERKKGVKRGPYKKRNAKGGASLDGLQTISQLDSTSGSALSYVTSIGSNAPSGTPLSALFPSGLSAGNASPGSSNAPYIKSENDGAYSPTQLGLLPLSNSENSPTDGNSPGALSPPYSSGTQQFYQTFITHNGQMFTGPFTFIPEAGSPSSSQPTLNDLRQQPPSAASHSPRGNPTHVKRDLHLGQVTPTEEDEPQLLYPMQHHPQMQQQQAQAREQMPGPSTSRPSPPQSHAIVQQQRHYQQAATASGLVYSLKSSRDIDPSSSRPTSQPGYSSHSSSSSSGLGPSSSLRHYAHPHDVPLGHGPPPMPSHGHGHGHSRSQSFSQLQRPPPLPMATHSHSQPHVQTHLPLPQSQSHHLSHQSIQSPGLRQSHSFSGNHLQRSHSQTHPLYVKNEHLLTTPFTPKQMKRPPLSASATMVDGHIPHQT